MTSENRPAAVTADGPIDDALSRPQEGPELTAEQLAFLDALVLRSGGHGPSAREYCVMEAVAFFAGEPHSDHPRCASKILTSFAMRLNDRWGDEDRQKLKPFIPRLVGTRDDGLDQLRGYMALDWLIRTFTPAFLDLAGEVEAAQELRALRRIADRAAAEAARPLVHSARAKAAAARSRSWSKLKQTYAADADAAAAAAAAYAADAAAAYAADAAAAYAADAAYDADAAYAAAAAAAYAAAAPVDRVAIRAKVREALEPTVGSLKASALDLLDRMIDGRWPE